MKRGLWFTQAASYVNQKVEWNGARGLNYSCSSLTIIVSVIGTNGCDDD